MRKTTHILFDKFEWKGIWWLPETPRNQVPGNLTFDSKNGVILILMGSLRDAQSWGSHDTFQPKIILGTTSEGIECTLLDTCQTQFQLHMPGIPSEKFEANYLFVGHHFKSKDDLQFPDLGMSLTNLEEWTERLPFHVEWAKTPSNESFKARVSYTEPPDFKIYVPSISSTILLESHLTQTGDGRRDFGWQRQDLLKLVPDQSQSFVWYLKRFLDLRLLLTLFIGEPIYPKFVCATGPDNEVAPGKMKRMTVEVFYGERWAKSPKERVQPHDMLATLPAIFGSLSQAFDRWFSRVEVLRPILDLFFGTLFAPEMYLNLHFLNFVRALEVYHRRTQSGFYATEKDYAKVYKSLAGAIPPGLPTGLRDALKGRLKYGNEYSLAKRLNYLFDSLPESLSHLISRDTKLFVRQIVDTRNYLTHFTKELEKKQIKGFGLVNANRKLQLLLTILLFRELGFDDKMVESMVLGKRQFETVEGFE